MSDYIELQIESSWKALLEEHAQQPSFRVLRDFLRKERKAKKTIYPPVKLLFKAFELVAFDRVKLVILGQDPYHGPEQAMGLSFSVPRGIAVPPSLKRIYKELETDIAGFSAPAHGDLTSWAEQGVFLLNTVLTVEAGKAGSHRKAGWEEFTDKVIDLLSAREQPMVFLLWGKPAQMKAARIDESKHLVLKAAHPSPLAGNAFFGNKHFSQANAFLEGKGIAPINWHLPSQ